MLSPLWRPFSGEILRWGEMAHFEY